MGAFGPSGMPSSIQTISIMLQVTRKKIEYGNITEINVPMPMFLSYFCANAMMIAKYVMSGVMMFVDESATRYAIVVSSGE